MKGNDLKWQLEVVFLYYTSFGDRNNYRYLKQQNFRRFLIDSSTVTNEIEFPYYDMAFIKIDKTSLIYEQFLEIIPNIAQIRYKNLNRKEAFKTYLANHIKLLFQDIIIKSDFGESINIITTIKTQYKTINLLENLHPIRKMYQNYIISTSAHQKIPIDTFDRLLIMLKDFQMSPQLVSISISYASFYYFTIRKQMNSKFTFQDFVEFLISIAELGVKKSIQESISQIGRVIRMLQRMQISPGFIELSKSMTRQTSNHVTFFTPQIMSYYEAENLGLSRFSQRYSAIQRFNTKSDEGDSRQKQFQTAQTLINENSKLSLKEIKKVFQDLCGYGQVGNSKTLKSIKIKKLYQKMNILQALGQTWLDLKITHLIKISTSGKVQFPQFLQLLHITAKKLSITFQQVIQLVLKSSPNKKQNKQKYNSNIYQSNHYFSLKKILSCIEKQLYKIFKTFSKGSEVIFFEQLMKFAYEYELFPQIITKNRLFQIFEENSEEGKSQKINFSLTQQSSLDYEGFENLIIRISEEINEDSISNQQKMIIVIEKMNQSKGQKNTSRSNTSLVHEIRVKYSNLYETKIKKQVKKVQKFDQLANYLE